mmetsp:Transcript_79395/g.149870  ORF Transcript_79395/g.149870 Transcript_79395/m.149870 type:complete len:503 (-) Transcript_79395:167-1675(-)
MGVLGSLWLAVRLAGRLIELAWLYLPLLPLLPLALLADLILQFARPGNKWYEAWFELFLRNVQHSGPVFVKLGQWAATRPDFVPETWCIALKQLQDRTQPHSLAHTHRILDSSFGRAEWSSHLLIEPDPIGSGCIAQVYKGLLQTQVKRKVPSSSRCGLGGILLLLGLRKQPPPTGVMQGGPTAKVAIKVIHPQVRRAIELDLIFLRVLATLGDNMGLERLGLPFALRQFAAFLVDQADFRTEANNLKKFRANYRLWSESVIFPQVYDRWVTENVMAMSFEEGNSLKGLLDAKPADSEGVAIRHDIWRKLLDSYFAMIFKYKFVHGDLHPGNVLWRPAEDGTSRAQIILLDVGLAIDISGEMGEDFKMMVQALLSKPEEEVAEMLMGLAERVGGKKEDVVDPQGFVKGIAALIREAKGYALKLSKFNATELMVKSLLLGRKHCVRFDARFVNLLVSMVVIQGVALNLNPDGDLLTRMSPYLFGAALSEVTKLGGSEKEAKKM